MKRQKAARHPCEGGGQNESFTNSIIQHSGPRCELYGRQIVDALPRKCPARSPRVFEAVLAIKNEAYRRLDLAGFNADPSAGLWLVAKANMCYRCFSANAAHPLFKRLRAAALREAERPHTGQPPRPPRPARQDARPAPRPKRPFTVTAEVPHE